MHVSVVEEPLQEPWQEAEPRQIEQRSGGPSAATMNAAMDIRIAALEQKMDFFLADRASMKQFVTENTVSMQKYVAENTDSIKAMIQELFQRTQQHGGSTMAQIHDDKNLAVEVVEGKECKMVGKVVKRHHHNMAGKDVQGKEHAQDACCNSENISGESVSQVLFASSYMLSI
jgi:hypothetical protein